LKIKLFIVGKTLLTVLLIAIYTVDDKRMAIQG